MVCASIVTCSSATTGAPSFVAPARASDPFCGSYSACAAHAFSPVSSNVTLPVNIAVVTASSTSDASSFCELAVRFPPSLSAAEPFGRRGSSLKRTSLVNVTFVSPLPASPVPSSACATIVRGGVSARAGSCSRTFSRATTLVSSPSAASVRSTVSPAIWVPGWPPSPAIAAEAAPAISTASSVFPSSV